jgi:Flp pilus assembly protein TadD
VQHNLASALARQGDLDEAIEHYEVAVRLKPDYGRAWLNLSQALALRGRSGEARALLDSGGTPR